MSPGVGSAVARREGTSSRGGRPTSGDHPFRRRAEWRSFPGGLTFMPLSLAYWTLTRKGRSVQCLIFTDYGRPAIRLSALMEIPVIHILTHDSNRGERA
jgi:hypothetical protein